MSKILERAVQKQLLSYLESEKSLTNSQYGFRPKRSTEMAATAFFDSIRCEVDKGNLVGAIFIDLRKAFDTLSHSKLIEKLSSYGIDNIELDWFTDYLFQRHITVAYRDSLSDKQKLFSGVAQGSILGPLLFLIYFNDVVDIIKNSHIIKYADDTVLYYTGKNIQQIEDKLSEDICHLADWFEDNELIINLKKGKSEVMLFGTSQKLGRLNKTLNIKYRYHNVNVTLVFKYIGIHIDSTLNLNSHFDKVFKKAAGRLKLLEKLLHQMDMKTATTIYNTMIVPILTYYSVHLINRKLIHQRNLKSFVTRAKNIINKNSSQPINLHPLEIIAEQRLCLFVRKCLDKNTIEHFQTYFELLQHRIGTRNKNVSLKLPKVRTEYGKRSVKFLGAKGYNSLPLEMKKIEHYAKFKNDLRCSHKK